VSDSSAKLARANKTMAFDVLPWQQWPRQCRWVSIYPQMSFARFDTLKRAGDT